MVAWQSTPQTTALTHSCLTTLGRTHAQPTVMTWKVGWYKTCLLLCLRGPLTLPPNLFKTSTSYWMGTDTRPRSSSPSGPRQPCLRQLAWLMDLGMRWRSSEVLETDRQTMRTKGKEEERERERDSKQGMWERETILQAAIQYTLRIRVSEHTHTHTTLWFHAKTLALCFLQIIYKGIAIKIPHTAMCSQFTGFYKFIAERLGMYERSAVSYAIIMVNLVLFPWTKTEKTNFYLWCKNKS